MTKDEALKMAIEALETCITYSAYEQGFETILVEKATQALQEALAQPAQEPQYLYVYASNGVVDYIYNNKPKGWAQGFVGKIKLEVDDD